MNQEDETPDWNTKREKELNSILHKSYVWAELMRCGKPGVSTGLRRLLKSLIYTIGSADILESVVDQDLTTHCAVEERLQQKLQVVVFTKKRVCIGTLKKPDDPNSVGSCTLKRSNIKRLSLSSLDLAFEELTVPERQHLCITAEYDGLSEPLVIGSQSVTIDRTSDYFDDSPSFFRRMTHIRQLIIDDLNS